MLLGNYRMIFPALYPIVPGSDFGSGVAQKQTHVLSLSLTLAKALAYLYSSKEFHYRFAIP